jgi:carboxyl-terminal processing protease
VHGEPRVSVFTLSGIALLVMTCFYLDVKPTHPRLQNLESQTKTAEEYWAQTGLQAKTLDALLIPEVCKSAERQFLACANAVTTVAQKYGVTITPDGEVKTGLSASARQIFAEKDLMVPWQKLIAGKAEMPSVPFLKIWQTLAKTYVPKNQEAYATGLGINGFFSIAEDPHTYILPSDYYSEVVARASHRSVSIGLVVGRNEQHYFVKKVLEGSPAEISGLKKGDVLQLINGKDAKSLSPYEVSHELKGIAGTTVNLEIMRESSQLSVSILRSERNIQTVSAHVLEGIKPVGVLTINKFASGTCDAAKAALETLLVQGITGLLLDLRDNPGGQMSEAACITGLFIGPGKSVYETKLLGDENLEAVTYTQQPQIYHGALAVLINSGSASAAEILAGALKDHHRGVLVGEKTFGKGSFQEGIVWSKNNKIAFFQTKGFYFLPSGMTPQLIGLEPDVKVSFKDKFALRESEQYIYPLQAPGSEQPSEISLAKTSFAGSSTSLNADNLVSCISFESEFVAPEDPEIREAHRILNCGGIAGRGDQ